MGKVFENLPSHKQVELHVYRALWAGVRAIWRPLYDAGNGELTLDAASAKEPVKEVVPYARLVLEVNLFVDGGMGHRPTRTLSEAGWSLFIPPQEVLRYLNQIAPRELSEKGAPEEAPCPDEVAYVLRGHKVCASLLGPPEPLKAAFGPLALARGPEPESSGQAGPPLRQVWELSGQAGSPPGRLNHALQAGAPRGSAAELAMAAEQFPTEHLMPLPESQAPQGGDEALAPGDPWPDEMPEALGHEGWLARLRNGDFSPPVLLERCYVPLRGEEAIGNPRQTDEYAEKCVEAVGLGSQPDLGRYQEFGPDDLDLLRWVVRRGPGCMWLPDTHRTRMRAMRHRIITRGPPIRQPPMRLTALDAQFTEDAMAEDAKRGQVERGHSPW